MAMVLTGLSPALSLGAGRQVRFYGSVVMVLQTSPGTLAKYLQTSLTLKPGIKGPALQTSLCAPLSQNPVSDLMLTFLTAQHEQEK